MVKPELQLVAEQKLPPERYIVVKDNSDNYDGPDYDYFDSYSDAIENIREICAECGTKGIELFVQVPIDISVNIKVF